MNYFGADNIYLVNVNQMTYFEFKFFPLRSNLYGVRLAEVIGMEHMTNYRNVGLSQLKSMFYL